MNKDIRFLLECGLNSLTSFQVIKGLFLTVKCKVLFSWRYHTGRLKYLRTGKWRNATPDERKRFAETALDLDGDVDIVTLCAVIPMFNIIAKHPTSELDRDPVMTLRRYEYLENHCVITKEKLKEGNYGN